MKNRNFTPVGALHPILFFAGVYVVALLLSIFICSSLFYSCNSSTVKTSAGKQKSGPQQAGISKKEVVVALR
jgi:hypothetical protein